jgi:hypothetical protein
MTAANNRGQGITLRAPSNTIGGTAAGAGNLISGNGNEGIFINIANSNIIQGNLIGTDGNGTAANTNGLGGIDGVGAINTGGGTNNIIGGTDPGSRNVISGNVGPSIEEGILLEGSGNTAQGNFIGVDVTGNVALGNAGAGILAQGGSSNLVGGTATGAGNRIAFNKSGVEIRGTGTGNAVLSNSIFSNSPGLGIDLYTGFVPNGVTPNDACDGDTGPNNFQNFPVISSVVSDNSTMTITGTLNSTASTVFRIEFFASPDCDPSGNGEGKTFVGSTLVTTDTTCNATISFNAPVGDLGGQFITATATDPQNNTSEFSPCECTPPSDRQLVNISSRASVGTGDNVAIGGFIIHSDSSTTTRLTNGTGVPTKRVLIRGIGPSLQAGGNPLAGRLMDPVLDLYDSNGTKIDHNDNWMEEPDGVNNPARIAAIQATGLAPTDPAEAALLETLNVDSAHTAILSGKSNTTGIGLVEIYDLEATSTTHLANLSTRAFVSTGDDVLIGGFIGQGCASARVLLRAIGPSLTAYNISNALVDPVLELHDANGALVDTNDDWMNSPNKTDIIATGLAPSNDKESAILFTPAPGAYTGVVLGKDPTPTGVGLVEAYNLGP